MARSSACKASARPLRAMAKRWRVVPVAIRLHCFRGVRQAPEGTQSRHTIIASSHWRECCAVRTERSNRVTERHGRRAAGAPKGCRRLSRFGDLECPKIFHQIKDSLVPMDPTGIFRVFPPPFRFPDYPRRLFSEPSSQIFVREEVRRMIFRRNASLTIIIINQILAGINRGGINDFFVVHRESVSGATVDLCLLSTTNMGL